MSTQILKKRGRKPQFSKRPNIFVDKEANLLYRLTRKRRRVLHSYCSQPWGVRLVSLVGRLRRLPSKKIEGEPGELLIQAGNGRLQLLQLKQAVEPKKIFSIEKENVQKYIQCVKNGSDQRTDDVRIQDSDCYPHPNFEITEKARVTPQCTQGSQSQKDSTNQNLLNQRPKRNKTIQSNSANQSLISIEEQRMINLALKKSLIERQNNIQTLDDIEQVKTYYPTSLEFKNPLEYIEQLYKEGASKYGIVKIVPPKEFSPILAFDCFQEKKFPTRFQVLQDLAQGKPFEQNPDGMTFQEFAKIGKQIEKEETEQDFWNLEKEYWNYVENQVGPKVQIQYAADLEVTQYGSGFGRKEQQIFDPRATSYVSHPWNLSNFHKQSESLMQFPRQRDLSGINIPWLYIGMKFSSFCWHYEDIMLYSINYNHWGKPKLWYGIPEDHREKFDRVAKEKLALLVKNDPNILLDIITMISPAYLKQNKIQVYKTLQMPGEFILTFPGSYHAGFSTGLNIGEAVNFVTKSWFDHGLKGYQIYQKSREKIPVFPLDWLLVENIRNLQYVNISLESKIKLRDQFIRVLQIEKDFRKQIEADIKELQGKSGLKRPVYYLMENRENVAEDEHQCQFCTDFAYLSLIQCKNHNFSYCIKHGLACGCPIENIFLVYRFTNPELEKFESKIKEECMEKKDCSKLARQQ